VLVTVLDSSYVPLSCVQRPVVAAANVQLPLNTSTVAQPNFIA